MSDDSAPRREPTIAEIRHSVISMLIEQGQSRDPVSMLRRADQFVQYIVYGTVPAEVPNATLADEITR